MMRILTIAILGAAVLYGGYWFLGRAAVQRGGTEAIARLEAAGWEVEIAERETVGFPSRFDTRLTEPRLTTPGGLTWSMPFLQIYALSWQPGRLIAEWPEQQELAWDGGAASIDAREMRASASVRAGTSLPLDRATLEAGETRIATEAGPVAFSELLAAIRPATGEENGYDVYAQASGLSALGVIEGATLTFDAKARLDAPIDRHALAAPRPRPEHIVFNRVSLKGSALDLSLRGELDIDAVGRSSGELSVETGDWRPVVAALREAGLLAADQLSLVEAGLQRLAPDGRVTLPLAVESGRIRLGPLPLGEAPRWF